MKFEKFVLKLSLTLFVLTILNVILFPPPSYEEPVEERSWPKQEKNVTPQPKRESPTQHRRHKPYRVIRYENTDIYDQYDYDVDFEFDDDDDEDDDEDDF